MICFYYDGPKIYNYNPFKEEFGTDVTNQENLDELLTHKIKNMYGHPIRVYHLDLVFFDRYIAYNRNGENKWVCSKF